MKARKVRKVNSKTLWEQWRDQVGPSDNEAIAHAVWVGNRLVKGEPDSTRRKFYSLKDAFVTRYQECLVEGRLARTETANCDACYGCGVCEGSYNWETEEFDLDLEEECSKCDGTGIYRSWHLYEHRFAICGQRYSFHSYVQPCTVSAEPGEDCESYGGRFTPEEVEQLAVPLSRIIKLLAYIATERWELVFDQRTGKFC